MPKDQMVGTFDLERYLRNSKKVDISNIDLTRAADYPLNDDEIRCLTYMMDIESHTVVYLRAILNTCAIEDTATTAFLSCWAYEEFFHGRTLAQFLAAAGIEFGERRSVEVHKQAAFAEWLKEMGASLICRFSRHFHAAYLTYGAISELSTLEGYGVLASRTANPNPWGNIGATGKRRATAFCVLLQQGEIAITRAECTAADKIHHQEFLAACWRRREARSGSELDSRVCPARLGGRENLPSHRRDDCKTAGPRVVRPADAEPCGESGAGIETALAICLGGTSFDMRRHSRLKARGFDGRRRLRRQFGTRCGIRAEDRKIHAAVERASLSRVVCDRILSP